MTEIPPEKHFEICQATITRLAQNSFAIKGWAVTFVSAICALATDKMAVAISVVPAIVFWGLDAFYLRQERLYRELYKAMMAGKVDKFSMDTQPYENEVQGWFRTCFSHTIAWLYAPITILAIVFAVHAFTNKGGI